VRVMIGLNFHRIEVAPRKGEGRSSSSRALGRLSLRVQFLAQMVTRAVKGLA
jgi:hypothetical protein